MRKLLNEELGRLSKEEFSNTTKMDIVVVLDNIRSHLNVGSVFRTCDAFPVKKIFLCGITGVPPHRDIQKTALGATETVAWQYCNSVTDAINELKESGYTIASVEQTENALPLHHLQKIAQKPLALIFGNEVEGVNQQAVKQSDYCIEIPQFGTKHSLNIAVSAGVVMWEAARILKLKTM
jgi:23S rRNA (guanosine2251-2'-O)-methyltransferase